MYTLKERAKHWRDFLYSKITPCFIFENFPVTVDTDFLKFCILHFGKACFIKVNGDLIVQPFVYADGCDYYYRPLKGIVTNPWISKNYSNFFDLKTTPYMTDTSFEIWNNYGKRVDLWGHGVISNMVWKTAYQLAENDISFKACQRNTRITNLVSVDDSKQETQLKHDLIKMYETGESTVLTSNTDLMSQVIENPLAHENKGNILELIELNQYIIANFLHTFGINSNYNLKRAQLQADEIAVNEYALKLNLTDILDSLNKGCERLNHVTGGRAIVRLNPVIYDRKEERGDDDVSDITDTEKPDESAEDN